MSRERMITYYERLKEMASNMQEQMQKEVEQGKELKKMSGTEFEDMVYEALQNAGFESDEITHSPQKFPDFVLKDTRTGKKVGVEVKKTDSSKWEVIGGSIYESLKNDTEDTYILMAKFGGEKPEVRLKKYEECIADLKVTHSPRFYLNLELEEGEDYLTQNQAKELLDLTGDSLNKKIRELLRTNKSTWWSEAETTPFSELSREEKNVYLNDGIVLFPEIFGGDYTNFTPWMIYNCLVWCGSVRDIFSAGGNKLIEECNIYVSAIMFRALDNAETVKDRIKNMSEEELSGNWNINPATVVDRVETWMQLVKRHLKLSTKLLDNNKSLPEWVSLNKQELRNEIIHRYIQRLEHIMRG